jgi:release factor glutamine methyltransferase
VTDARSTVAAALAQARERGVARLDAQLMLARLAGVDRTWLIAHDDLLLDADLGPRWASWLERRAVGEPLAYLLGEKEFHGLLLEVGPAVLVPRPETELLVDWAVAMIDDRGGCADVVDLGTGSGAIALAIRHARPGARVAATDASPAALAIAKANAERLALPIELIAASWWQGLEGRRFDLVLANPPYVRADDPALDALAHEPRMALTPEGDGLGALATIIDGAAEHLRADGWLLLEHGFDQAAPVADLMRRAGFEDIQRRQDLAGHPRASGGRRARQS